MYMYIWIAFRKNSIILKSNILFAGKERYLPMHFPGTYLWNGKINANKTDSTKIANKTGEYGETLY